MENWILFELFIQLHDRNQSSSLILNSHPPNDNEWIFVSETDKFILSDPLDCSKVMASFDKEEDLQKSTHKN